MSAPLIREFVLVREDKWKLAYEEVRVDPVHTMSALYVRKEKLPAKPPRIRVTVEAVEGTPHDRYKEHQMPWNFSAKAPKPTARATFVAAPQQQPSYAIPGPHTWLMDQIALFASSVAEAAPDGTECALTSSGHVDTDGTGSLTLTLNFNPIAKP